MRIGVVSFPGVDLNLINVMKQHFHNEVEYISLDSSIPESLIIVIITSNELYFQNSELRERVASSKIIGELKSFANSGGVLVGIHSGMDVLVRAKLLPGKFEVRDGAPVKNEAAYFSVSNRRSPLTYFVDSDKPLLLYNSSSYGYYLLAPEEAAMMKNRGQVILRFCDSKGVVQRTSCGEYASDCIAAISNKKRNVFGILPNPAVKTFHQMKLDGVELIDSFLKMITR